MADIYVKKEGAGKPLLLWKVGMDDVVILRSQRSRRRENPLPPTTGRNNRGIATSSSLVVLTESGQA